MTQATVPDISRDAASTSPRRGRGWVHFGVAVAVLLAATGWWLFARYALEWWLRKQAVPWPPGVEIREDFRLSTRSLPERLGDYVMVGDEALPQDTLDLLGVGTSYDRQRLPDRTSNWYCARQYQYQGPDAKDRRHLLWQLDLTYYTGALDNVPHTPETCLEQSGANVLGTDDVVFQAPDGVAPPWNGKLEAKRVRYDSVRSANYHRGAQYYTFVLNGKSEDEWENVYLELTLPWVRYCYFAKIQITPLDGQADDWERVDREAEQFLQAVLPEVLKAMPTPEYIRELSRQEN